MNNDDTLKTNEASVSRRTTLTLAAGVAAPGVALSMRSNAFAQGKGEGKMEGKGEGKGEGNGFLSVWAGHAIAANIGGLKLT